MSHEVIKYIEKSVKEMKDSFPGIYFSYEYIEKSNSYEIWYNSRESRNDIKFKDKIGEIITVNLFDEGIFNFYIDYNEEKSNEYEFYTKHLESFYSVINDIDIEFYSVLDATLDLTINNSTLQDDLKYKRIESCNPNYSLAA